MARKKIIETTAAELPTHREETQNREDDEVDPFAFFCDETQHCLLSIRRIEPAIERGIVVSGHLPSLTLSPAEAQNLASIFVSKPGYGGGLYSIRHQKQKANGGYEFGRSFRLRVAGPSRALDLHDAVQAAVQPAPAAQPQQAAAPTPMQPTQMASMAAYPPPPWWVGQQHMPTLPAQPGPADVPKLIEVLASVFRAQPTSPLMGQMDVVQLIQSLQKTVQPEKEDELTKLAKFAGILDKLRGSQSESQSTSGIDWGALVGGLREVLRPAQPQPQVPMMAPRPQAPMQVPRNPVPMTVPEPPGWRWTGSEWVPREPPSQAEEPAAEESEEEEEDEEGEDIDDDTPLTAQQLAESFLAEVQKMAPDEQAKLREMASAMFGG